MSISYNIYIIQMQLRNKMTIEDYLKKLEEICKREFMSATKLVSELNVSHNTYMKIKRSPETCSSQTLRKVKVFVDAWELKNSVINVSDLH
jgi:hypothetical protein